MQPTLSHADLIELPVRLLQGDPFLPYWDMLYSGAIGLAVVVGLFATFFSLGLSARALVVVVIVINGCFFGGKALLSTGLPQSWVSANGQDAARIRHVMTGKPVAPDELTRTDVMKSVKWLEGERKEIEAMTRRLTMSGAPPEQVEMAIEEMLMVRRRNR